MTSFGSSTTSHSAMASVSDSWPHAGYDSWPHAGYDSWPHAGYDSWPESSISFMWCFSVPKAKVPMCHTHVTCCMCGVVCTAWVAHESPPHTHSRVAHESPPHTLTGDLLWHNDVGWSEWVFTISCRLVGYPRMHDYMTRMLRATCAAWSRQAEQIYY